MAKKKAEKKRAPPLLADIPISETAQDELERTPFARSLANTILAMRGMESFVFALCGAWGSGKSSILRLVERELESAPKKHRPIVVSFNPWWFSGQDQLLRAFLDQLGAAVGRNDIGRRAAKIGKGISTLGKVLRPLSWIPGGGNIVKDISETIQAAGEATQDVGKKLSADVHNLRAEIDRLLAESERRIVIVMDDIDRLTASEIADVFLIVKAVADFPNTIYLLAFDPGVVAAAIKEKLGLDGDAYLEKIVQVQVDIPPASRVSIQQMFLRQFDSLIDKKVIGDKSRHYFSNLFHTGIKDFLDTPRDVKRLVNVLRVLYPAMEGELYWPDFIAVMALMVFAPIAYRTIRDNATEFTDTDQPDSYKYEERKKFHQQWLTQVPDAGRSAISGLVCRMFPKVEHAIEGHGYSNEFISEWRSDMRACSSDYFERYFTLAVPTGAISEAEWRRIVGMLSDVAAIDGYIEQLCTQPGRHGFTTQAKEFLDRAQTFAKHKATVEEAKLLFVTLLRTGDLFILAKDTEPVYLMEIRNDMRLSWALQAAISRIEDQGEREKVIVEALSQPCGLRAATELVWLLGAEHGMFTSEPPMSPVKERLVSKACVDNLLKIVAGHIRMNADDGRLVTHPQFLLIASEWRRFTETDEAKDWIQCVTKEDSILLKALGQALSTRKSHSLHDHVARESRHIDAKFVTSWFDPLSIRARCQGLIADSPGWLTDDDREALNLLVASIDDEGNVVDSWGERRRKAMSTEEVEEDGVAETDTENGVDRGSGDDEE